MGARPLNLSTIELIAVVCCTNCDDEIDPLSSIAKHKLAGVQIFPITGDGKGDGVGVGVGVEVGVGVGVGVGSTQSI